MVSGDLHAIGTGRFSRSGTLDLESNPVNAVLSGPISTPEYSFPSVIRGIGATPSAHLDLEEMAPPVEDHGFTLIDFLRDRILLRQFAWDVDREPLEAIDRLEPFYTTEMERPGQ